MTSPARRLLDATISEDHLQRDVIHLATRLGYEYLHIRDARGQAVAGCPDLVLARWHDRRLIVVELKAVRGRVTPGQRDWLALFARAGVETGLWRPAQWSDGTVERALVGGGERAPPSDGA